MTTQDKEFLNQFKDILLEKIKGTNSQISNINISVGELKKTVEGIEKRTVENTTKITTVETRVEDLKENIDKDEDFEKGDRIIEADWKLKTDEEIKKIWFYIGKVIGFNTLAGALAGGIVGAFMAWISGR